MSTASMRILSAFAVAAAALWLGTVSSFAAGDVVRGKAIYLKYCRGCHGVDGRGGGDTFMPHVARLTERGYIDMLPDEYLFQVIAEGGAFVGKSSYMPAWKSSLSDEDINDVIVHIRRLRLH